MNPQTLSRQGSIGCIEDALRTVVPPQRYQRAGDTSGAITVALETDAGSTQSQLRRLSAIADRWGYTLTEETETDHFLHVRLEAR